MLQVEASVSMLRIFGLTSLSYGICKVDVRIDEFLSSIKGKGHNSSENYNEAVSMTGGVTGPGC